jgi:hypothetical protein
LYYEATDHILTTEFNALAVCYYDTQPIKVESNTPEKIISWIVRETAEAAGISKA